MLPSLVFLATLTNRYAACSDHSSFQRFSELRSSAIAQADARNYSLAALEMERAAVLYENCMHQGRAIDGHDFPLEGAEAYSAGAVLRHLAAQIAAADEDLKMAKLTLSERLRAFPESRMSPDQQAYLDGIRMTIRDAEAGHWPVWSE